MKTVTLESLGYELKKENGKLIYNGYIDLSDTGITSLPDNLTVGGSLYLSDTGITSLPDNLTVGESLYLRGTGITSLPGNLTVGGSLYLRGAAITSLPDNLTIGGWLDLSGAAITSLPDNLTVGESLYLRGTGITDTSKVNRTVTEVLSWQDGKYIKVDGVFSEVVSHRGNVCSVKKIGKTKLSYMVTDGNGKWSHGETLKEAREDLIFKISNMDKSLYDGLTHDNKLTYEDAIECYRVVTGACAFGTKDFVLNRLNDRKKKYTIAEIAKLTKGEYGNQNFMEFFKIKQL